MWAVVHCSRVLSTPLWFHLTFAILRFKWTPMDAHTSPCDWPFKKSTQSSIGVLWHQPVRHACMDCFCGTVRGGVFFFMFIVFAIQSMQHACSVLMFVSHPTLTPQFNDPMRLNTRWHFRCKGCAQWTLRMWWTGTCHTKGELGLSPPQFRLECAHVNKCIQDRRCILHDWLII